MDRVRQGRSGLRRRIGTVIAVGAAGALAVTALAAPAQSADATRAGAAADVQADVNVAKNAGFESDLSNWTCAANSGAVVTSPVHGGTKALKATPSGQNHAECSQIVKVKPNSTYKLSSWVQGGYAYLGARGTGTTDVSTWTPGTSSWQQLSTSFTTGANTTSVTVYTHGWYGQSAYHVDDVNVFGPDGGGGTDPVEIPAVPSGLTAGTATSTSVDLSWSPVSTATGYTVYRDGTKVAAVSGASTTVTGLTPETTYSFQVSASNAAGESAKSTAVTARTTKGGGGDGGTVPKHALTGYWQNFDNGATVQKLRDVSSQYDIIAVSFADATSTPGQITFNLDPAVGYSSVADFKADIAAKKAAGKSVILSVGGEKGTISVNSDASATAFANSAYALMQEYGFSGVDIDLENGLNPTYMTKALRQLSAKAGPKMVLTMAPQTIDMQSTSGGYFQTALNVKDILTVVNMQYYNSGSMLGCDGKVYSQGSVDFLTALACIQLEGGLDASQVGIGVPASPRGAGSGYVSPTIVNNALDCLARGTGCGSFKPSKTYPGLRGAMTWSTNWDATAGSAWSNAVGPKVHSLP
ncbi:MULTISPECIES: glycoside hydrolase family 18 protein [unclassified Streptomyces]|uniref:carbohydrate binding domain-containing protein n=1 Tax=unclassified Streptomyces TaxID=2593676 RepID=UPI00136FCF9C|nr:chitinase [Streptomyces sp. SID10115]NEA04304.1 chitinase [Streptomyces sp. SID10116]NEB46308.1 chitinase [Streptomyces sp. SID339]